MSRLTIYRLLLIVSVFLPFKVFSTTVKFIQTDKSFGKTLEIDGNFAGYLEDFIELDDGTHSLKLNGPSEHKVYIIFKVSKDSISYQEHSSYRLGRGTVYDISVPTPLITKSEKWKNVNVVDLQSASRSQKKGFQGIVLNASLGCDRRVVKLQVASSPEGAEIWVQGKKQATTSNSTLGVSVCQYHRTLDVLLRKEGYINQQKIFTLDGQKEFKFESVMSKIEAERIEVANEGQ